MNTRSGCGWIGNYAGYLDVLQTLAAHLIVTDRGKGTMIVTKRPVSVRCLQKPPPVAPELCWHTLSQG